jgi:hypothetical protein
MSNPTVAGNTTSTTTSAPWGPQQAPLEAGIQDAVNLYATGGPQYYPGSTVAPQSSQTQQGIQALTNFGNTTQPITTSANNFSTGLFNGSGIQNNPANGLLYGQAQTSNPALMPAAMNAYNTPGASILNSINPNASLAGSSLSGLANGAGMTSPYLSGAINAADTGLVNSFQTATAPSLQGQMEMAGRFGSGAATNQMGQAQLQLGTALGNANNSILNTLYPQLQSNQINAANIQQTGQLGQENAGISAAGTLGTNTNNAVNTYGSLFNNNLSTNIGASSALGSNYNNNLNTTANALGNASAIQQMPLANAQALTTAGSLQDAYNQNVLNSQIQAYNYGQQAPYLNLSNYMNEIGGNYGGTSSTTQPYFGPSTASQVMQGVGSVAMLAAMY